MDVFLETVTLTALLKLDFLHRWDVYITCMNQIDWCKTQFMIRISKLGTNKAMRHHGASVHSQSVGSYASGLSS